MKRKWIIPVVLLLALLPLVLASAAGNFDLPWWSVDGGGGQSGGAGFTLQGASGQPDAGLMQGGGFTLAGGFLGGAGVTAPPERKLFLPLIYRP